MGWFTRKPKTPPPPEAPVDGWAVARAWLLDNPRNHFEQDPRFAIRDPALIDPLLQAVLDRRHGGEMPTTRKAAEGVAKQVMGPYRALRQKPEGRAAIATAIRATYDEGEVSVDARGRVVSDHGLAPGPFERYRNRWTLRQSEVAPNGSWPASEFLPRLDRVARAHPDATDLSVKVAVPHATVRRVITVRWLRDEGKLAITDSGQPNVAHVADGVFDLGPILRGERELAPDGLRRVSTKDRFYGRDPDVPFH